MNWQTHKKMLLKNPDFQRALKEVEPELQIARTVIEARIKSGLPQKVFEKKL